MLICEWREDPVCQGTKWKAMLVVTAILSPTFLMKEMKNLAFLSAIFFILSLISILTIIGIEINTLPTSTVDPATLKSFDWRGMPLFLSQALVCFEGNGTLLNLYAALN
jgi:hypothetical protein